MDLGKEIERLERQAAIDAELNKPTSEPITNKPNNHPDGEEKTGRATDNYRRTFWNAMRRKNFFDVENALQVGTDSEGGYLVPDEFEHTLVEALEEESGSVYAEEGTAAHALARRHGLMKKGHTRNRTIPSGRSPSARSRWPP